MKQLLLILNPTAGTKKAGKYLSNIISVFNQAEYDTHVYITTCRGDATKAVIKYGEEKNVIVCCGGDGTLNETITGIQEKGLDVGLGYIPAGSTNDFANSLHLSNDVLKAAEQIVDGDSRQYDVGKFNERYFSYIASFGAFTKSSYSTRQSLKNTLGHLAYILDGIQEITSIKKEYLRMEIEGEVIEDDYLFGAICNSTSVGGILTLSSEVVDMSDGKFEILLIRAPKNIQELHECVIALHSKKYDCGMITFRSASEIKITANPDMSWTLDGERAEGCETIRVINLHNKMKLLH